MTKRGVLLGIWLVFVLGIMYLLNGVLEMQPVERMFYSRVGYLDTPQGSMVGLAMLVIFILVLATFLYFRVVSKIYKNSRQERR